MDNNVLKMHPEQQVIPEQNITKPRTKESPVDGIEILVDMAKSGKIDPWNIDIADVTDKYLQKLVEIKSYNLKLTGRTLFFAALLLRLKSDVLEGISVFDEEPPEPEIFEEFETPEEIEESINYNNVISLDQVLERRTSVRLHKERVVTLEDLIKQLEFYEKLDKKLAQKNRQQKASQKIRSYENFTSEDIVNMAHDEYIENSVAVLQESLTKLFETDEKIELSKLIQTGMDKVSAYIALLFLASRSRIELVQDEFYSDLYVVQENETVENESSIKD